MRTANRGVDFQDSRWFSEKEVIRLKKAQEEIFWLLNRNYNTNSIMNFVGGHYQFSIRQRQALKRSTGSKKDIEKRISKIISCENIKNDNIYIDGFNLIITLEVALSGGILVVGNDGAVRDIAGIQGSYHLIDKTDRALEIIGEAFDDFKATNVKFFLDSPVSNSGRLKERILLHSISWNCNISVDLVPNADNILCDMGRIVTSDSIILDKCKSWFNLTRKIVEDYVPNARLVDLT
ncbi:hypothetical protein AGR56_14080 [Clostridium sp. DMHC 10]|uniref:DUF434 domain-containing protein n=1 Tax=Clostridium sp. DMHC 10 TaxID=747377 RepID=UPI00069F3408|nr:DUF434 domain-containing protein [Clostridium sp. DMHC 10]KOF57496.1 hypothetical protein AGR56_14080 [Clostridium sp. DMHC 10]